MRKKLQTFYSHLDQIYQLNCIEQLLGWDENVYMPRGGEPSRTKQNALMNTLIHQRQTEPKFVALVDELYAEREELNADDAINIREVKRTVDNARKLPDEFVGKKASAHSQAFACWAKARPANDFNAVLPYLKTNIELAKEEAEYLGYEGCRYDALLDIYEPGSTLAIVHPALSNLGSALKEILPTLKEQAQQRGYRHRACPTQLQEKMGQRIASDLGYTSVTGRIDAAPHPFMTSIGPRDTRITTRYEENNYLSNVLSTLHEAGHGLYELGFEERFYGTPRGEAVSLSIHESQSRFYENIIGRGRAFSSYLYHLLEEVAPELSTQTSEEEIWNTVNHVESSLIRTEADEVTYSLHIVIRTLLEAELINEDLPVEELPIRWSELYKEYLDIAVPDDKDGVMQDVHWFHGTPGYFPTYALGNLYGALMYRNVQRDIPDLDDFVRNGAFEPLLSWLREHIHKHGMTYNGPEIAERLSGAPLSHLPFIEYLKEKHGIS